MVYTFTYNGWLKTFSILRFLNLKKPKNLWNPLQREHVRMTTATNQLTAYDLFFEIDFIERKDGICFVLVLICCVQQIRFQTFDQMHTA